MIKRRLYLSGAFLLLFPLACVGQSLQLADSLLKKGKSYDRSGKMEQSAFYYREAYNIYRDFQDTASWLEAGKEYASAMVYRSRNEKAMELYKKLLAVDHPANGAYNRGDLYNSMGWSSKRIGKIEQAQKYYQKSLPLAKNSGDSLLIGVVFSNLGGTHQARGDLSQARNFYKKSLPYFRGINRKRNVAIALGKLGGVFSELSLYNQALEYYNRSLKIRKELDSVYLLATIYNSIGSIQRNLGNYDQALVSLKKSLGLSRKAGTPQRTAGILNSIGLLYKNIGEYEKGLDYYRQSLAIRKETDGPSSIATTINNLGQLLWEQGKKQEAGKYYKKALELHRQVGSPYDMYYSLNTMLRLTVDQRNFKEARAYANQLKTIGDSTDSYDMLESASAYLGRIDAEQGNNQSALQHFKKSYAYSKYLPPTEQLTPLKNLAQHYHKLNSDSTLFYGQKAISIIENQRSKAGAVSELKSGYFGQHSEFYTQMASWALTYGQDLSRAYKFVEQAKARALSEDLAQASQNIDQELPEKVRVERNNKRQHISSLYSRLESTADKEKRAQIQKKIRSAELDYQAYENSLRSRHPKLKFMQSPDPIRLERAQEITGEQTAVLEYAVANNQLIIFMITPNNVKAEQLSLSDEKSIDQQLTSWVSNFKSAILSSAPRSKLRSQSAKLYDALLKPFEDNLQKFSNLIIVPDGALAYLPFEAISQGDQYLIEDFNIKYEPSLTSLTLLDESKALNRQDLLAVAGSQLSGENVSKTSLRKKSLSALPSTVMEVDSIAKQFKQTSVLKEEEVSEQNFKKVLQNNQYRYIHMATHGIIDENHPSRSGLALSTAQEITASSKEDGMLRSSEIFGLNINTDMVVLSACNTGLGKVVKGEGMLGMQRSFFYAGASSVVVSLWNVFDRSTASFMDEFYNALVNTESKQGWTDSMLRWIGWDESIPFGRKASAMREAKLQMIKHPLYNHPVYWAPFIVVGR